MGSKRSASAARGADVDPHIRELDRLIAFGYLQEVDRLFADHAGDAPLRGQRQRSLLTDGPLVWRRLPCSPGSSAVKAAPVHMTSLSHFSKHFREFPGSACKRIHLRLPREGWL